MNQKKLISKFVHVIIYDDKMALRHICSTDILLDEKWFLKKCENFFNLWRFIQNFYGFKTVAY